MQRIGEMSICQYVNMSICLYVNMCVGAPGLDLELRSSILNSGARFAAVELDLELRSSIWSSGARFRSGIPSLAQNKKINILVLN